MPWGDGTGPMGLGPMTGRAAGYCAGYNVPGYLNPTVPRWGWYGGGWGRGRGYRHWYYLTGLPGWARFGYYPYSPVNPYYYQGPIGNPNITREQQINILKNQAEILRKNLEDINKAISDLEKEQEET